MDGVLRLTFPLLKVLHRLLETLQVLEILVYACPSDVCDGVQGTEVFHDHLADGNGRDFRASQGMKLAFHVLYYTFDSARGNWALGTGNKYAVQEFAPVEVLSLPIPLDDLELDGFDAFVGGEAMTTMGALAPPADAVLRRARVGDLGVYAIAVWTLHCAGPADYS